MCVYDTFCLCAVIMTTAAALPPSLHMNLLLMSLWPVSGSGALWAVKEVRQAGRRPQAEKDRPDRHTPTHHHPSPTPFRLSHLPFCPFLPPPHVLSLLLPAHLFTFPLLLPTRAACMARNRIRIPTTTTTTPNPCILVIIIPLTPSPPILMVTASVAQCPTASGQSRQWRPGRWPCQPAPSPSLPLPPSSWPGRRRQAGEGRRGQEWRPGSSAAVSLTPPHPCPLPHCWLAWL